MVTNDSVSRLRIQGVVVLIGLLLLIVKFLAYFFTHSNAILTDAMESIVNVVAGAFGFFSLQYALKPGDKEHPYGHGKIEYISSGVEGMLILFAGITMIGKSIYNFFIPYTIHDMDLGILLGAGAGLINYIAGWILVKKGKETRTLIMQASGVHLQSDAYSSAGMVLGLVIVFFTGWVWLDNLIAVLFGGIISYTGLNLVRRSLKGVMDEANEELLAEVIQTIDQNRKENWIDLHNLRVIKYGDRIHVDCHMTLPWYLSLKESHDEVDALEQLTKKDFGMELEFFIHTDPCIPESCKVCQLTNCQVRQQAFEKKVAWNMQTVLESEKHKL